MLGKCGIHVVPQSKALLVVAHMREKRRMTYISTRGRTRRRPCIAVLFMLRNNIAKGHLNVSNATFDDLALQARRARYPLGN